MPLIYLFLFCLVLAVNPALILVGLIGWLLVGVLKRDRKISNAGVNAMFGGSSMVDSAVARGRRRL